MKLNLSAQKPYTFINVKKLIKLLQRNKNKMTAAPVSISCATNQTSVKTSQTND